jgi:hypothetical protein
MDNTCIWFTASTNFETHEREPAESCKRKKCTGLDPNCAMYHSVSEPIPPHADPEPSDRGCFKSDTCHTDSYLERYGYK